MYKYIYIYISNILQPSFCSPFPSFLPVVPVRRPERPEVCLALRRHGRGLRGRSTSPGCNGDFTKK